MVGVLLLAAQAAAVLSIYLISLAIYRVYFHPLRSFPGPKLWAITRIPVTYYRLKGDLPRMMYQLHAKYGPVVRYEANMLSYISSEAWEDIYGFCKGTKVKNYPKDLRDRLTRGKDVESIITADEEDHRRLRRMLAHAFSDRALASQEVILQDYARQFIEGLKQEAQREEGGVVGLGKWYNFTTFDVIGDLAFGESFNCVKTGKFHPFIVAIFDVILSGVWFTEAKRYPLLKYLVFLVLPITFRDSLKTMKDMAAEKAQRRMNTETSRPDFMSYILKNNDTEKGMTFAEIRENAFVLLLAGSETTATSLTGMTYYLLKNRHILDKLTNEVRTAFPTREEMTIQKLAGQKYLHAVIEEGMRLFPAVPVSLPRTLPPEGGMICNNFVPGNTHVGVDMWVANKSPLNFSDPESYIPERWLNDPAYANDDLRARQPFSWGPANCLGKNLAYTEMRLLLAHLVWHFDMQLVEKEGEQDWLSRTKMRTIWSRDELMVQLTLREEA